MGHHEWVRAFRATTDALPRPAFEALRDALLASPLVGGSTLAGPFQASRGFAVIFRAAGLPRLAAHFPTLQPWLDRALGLPAVRALTPWWRRRPTRAPNAWYLNVLLVSAGGTVGRHVDATLRRPAGEPDALPELVTVLYLSVPDAPGGGLRLWRGARPLARVWPRKNGAVHFRGELAHEVEPFTGAPGALRASLVIEQYHLGAEALLRLPDFQLESRAGFGAYLAHHAGRPPRPFDLER